MEDVICFILLILVLSKTSHGGGRGRRTTREVLVLEEEGLMGTAEGKRRAEMVDLWIIHWEFLFPDVVQR